MSIMGIHPDPDPHPLNSRLQTAAAMDVLPANQTVAKGMRGLAIIFNRAEERLQQSK